MGLCLTGVFCRWESESVACKHHLGLNLKKVCSHDLFTENWMALGLVGCVAHTLLVFISIKPLRKRFYDAFYMGHVVLVL